MRLEAGIVSSCLTFKLGSGKLEIEIHIQTLTDRPITRRK